MDKRGQATPFIILGIVIVVILIVVISVYKPELISRRLNEAQLEPIRNYIEDCMQEVLDESLFVLKENAGRFKCGRNLLIGDDIVCELQPYYQNDDWNDLIDDRIENKLRNDCSLDEFSEYEISKGNIKADTKIGWHETIVNVDYPLIISKGDTTLELNKFSVSKKDEFGILNSVAGMIYEAEKTGKFDFNNWKQNSIYKGEELLEIKKEPYEGIGDVFIIISYDESYRFIIVE